MQQQLSIASAILTGLAGSHKRQSITGDTSHASVRVTSAQAWFTSSQLQSHLTGAVSELQSALNRMREAWDEDSGHDDRGQYVCVSFFFKGGRGASYYQRKIIISQLDSNAFLVSTREISPKRVIVNLGKKIGRPL